jgi:hypothetical protein
MDHSDLSLEFILQTFRKNDVSNQTNDQSPAHGDSEPFNTRRVFTAEPWIRMVGLVSFHSSATDGTPRFGSGESNQNVESLCLRGACTLTRMHENVAKTYS